MEPKCSDSAGHQWGQPETVGKRLKCVHCGWEK